MRLIAAVLAWLWWTIVPGRAEAGFASGEVQLQLQKLRVLGSVLMIAAHPDDEDMALLAYFGKGRLLRTAYLSLTRGEGGQNLIGPEQGALLGVIRTQELLASRRLDGAEQYFTRAIDFGYTKTPEEALRRWGKEEILADMVRVIRAYRPDVIVLRFSGTSRDGHGHHQASAWLGKEAYAAAGDAQRADGLEPWQAVRLLHNTLAFFPYPTTAKPDAIQVDMGEYSPLLGLSFTEIGGISRSQHRSQAMGMPLWRGPAVISFEMRAGAAAQRDPMDGIDTSWGRVPSGSSVDEALKKALAAYQADQPWRAVPGLVEARRQMRKLSGDWVRRKLAESDEALAACLGLRADLLADQHTTTPGAKVKVRATVIQRSPAEVVWSGFRLGGGVGAAGGALKRNVPVTREETWTAPEEFPQPYWLRLAPAGDRYTLASPHELEEAENPAPLQAEFVFEVDGEELRLRRPLKYVGVDPVRGEFTRPVAVVPPVSVRIAEPVLIAASDEPRSVRVELRSYRAAAGSVKLEAGPGWQIAPAGQEFAFAGAGEQRVATFSITPPRRTGSARLRATAMVEGKELTHGVEVIEQPHIPAQTVLTRAEARAERLEVRTLARQAGYIAGAGDKVAESIEQLGVRVVRLSDEDLAYRDLSSFDAIVTGVRAYNVRAAVRANQGRLLEYVAGGGTLIVQYNVAEGGPGMRGRTGALERLGPFPLTIGRGRVSVEDAPVTFLKPGHPLLTTPNRIVESDFEGWVQERGLYFASQWDPRYEAVLSTSDPGEEPLAGGLLYTRHGKGVFIFTGYAWFRQLPAGVPGAFRMFANLLSAGAALRGAR
jgi:LmbE family N-acetylglucosaminyl deacetylase